MMAAAISLEQLCMVWAHQSTPVMLILQLTIRLHALEYPETYAPCFLLVQGPYALCQKLLWLISGYKSLLMLL